MSIPIVHQSADISPDGLYRYSLTRVWNPPVKRLCFIMLNPSTADATQDDPTIRRCIGFGKKLGFGGIVVVNLFAYRATDPIKLRTALNAEGPLNDLYIANETRQAGRVMCAWGTGCAIMPYRAPFVVNMLKAAGTKGWALKLSKHGIPMHPLYLPYDLEPVRFV